MPVFVVLLRAVNVGGTGKLPMSDLKRLCEKAGFRNVRTYIASGNVVAERDGREAEAKSALEAELKAYAGKAGRRDRADGRRDGQGRQRTIRSRIGPRT